MARYRLVVPDGPVLRREWSSIDDLADNVDAYVRRYLRVYAQRFNEDTRHWESCGHVFGIRHGHQTKDLVTVVPAKRIQVTLRRWR